jgi:hypothetical protein
MMTKARMKTMYKVFKESEDDQINFIIKFQQEKEI